MPPTPAPVPAQDSDEDPLDSGLRHFMESDAAGIAMDSDYPGLGTAAGGAGRAPAAEAGYGEWTRGQAGADPVREAIEATRVPAAERRRERRGGSPFVLMYGPKQLWKRLRGLGVRLFCVSRLT